MNNYEELQNSYVTELQVGDKIGRALALIFRYGGIDGEHHKTWLLDQVVRTLTECPQVDKLKVLKDGTSFTYKTLGESEEYKKFCEISRYGEDGEFTYGERDTGIAP